MKDLEKEFLNELVRLDISQEDIDETKNVFASCKDVADTLSNPLVTHDEKRNIIKRIFPQSMEKFIMNAVKNGIIDSLTEIFAPTYPVRYLPNINVRLQ